MQTVDAWKITRALWFNGNCFGALLCVINVINWLSSGSMCGSNDFTRSVHQSGDDKRRGIWKMDGMIRVSHCDMMHLPIRNGTDGLIIRAGFSKITKKPFIWVTYSVDSLKMAEPNEHWICQWGEKLGIRSLNKSALHRSRKTSENLFLAGEKLLNKIAMENQTITKQLRNHKMKPNDSYLNANWIGCDKNSLKLSDIETVGIAHRT